MFGRLGFKFSEWKFDRRMAKQRAKRGFADDDCWGMVCWFTDTFVKMIRNLRDMKHGAPELEFEEFDNFPLLWVKERAEELRKYKLEKGYDEGEIDFWGKEKYFDRWWMILDRIAWCLEQAEEDKNDTRETFNEYEEEYHKQVWGEEWYSNDKKSFKEWIDKFWTVSKRDEKGRPKLWTLTTNEPDEDLKKKYYDRIDEINKYKESCKDEAFDLIKKYFYHLWD